MSYQELQISQPVSAISNTLKNTGKKKAKTTLCALKLQNDDVIKTADMNLSKTNDIQLV